MPGLSTGSSGSDRTLAITSVRLLPLQESGGSSLFFDISSSLVRLINSSHMPGNWRKLKEVKHSKSLGEGLDL